jgi:KAP family P-loop domain
VKGLPDSLSHDDIARTLIQHLTYLPKGSVIAVQGSWGRGKTDILERVNSMLCQAASSSRTPPPAWINPWQYGVPDLLSPLVIELINRVGPEDRRNARMLKSAAKTLLRVGTSIAIQGASLVVPVVGPLMSGATKPVDDFIQELFDTDKTETPYDSVKAMADSFRKLVDQYQRLTNSQDHPLVILVDDLDRCLPDQQIAILESIHFLTSAEANCHFLIAIDPQLVAQAAISHYKVYSFDTEQFLDKLFDLRISLQYLRSEQTLSLFKSLLGSSGKPASISSSQMKRLVSAFPDVFIVPAVNNPRVMTRVARRMQLLLLETKNASWLNSDLDAFALLSWACICERWSSLRVVFQIVNTRTIDPGSLYEIITEIKDRYSGITASQESRASRRSIIERLPPIEREPDLGLFLANSLNQGHDQIVQKWVLLDGEMCHAAL